MPRSASSSIRVSQFMHEEDLVRVAFQRDFPEVAVGEFHEGPFEGGSEAKLPLWVAKILEADGVVKIDEGQQLRPNELYKLSMRERGEILYPLIPHFYSRVRDLLSRLNSAVKSNPTVPVLNEQRQVQMKAQDLVNCRLQKIMRLALERNPAKSSIDALEPEERALFNILRTEIEDWRQKILEGSK